LEVRLLAHDSIYPNSAIMKLSTYHKEKGDNVSWHIPAEDQIVKPDIIYSSKVFKFSPEYDYFPEGVVIIKGGSGYDITSRLPTEVEAIRTLDYSLYPGCDFSLQWFSIGCIRKCPFCIVYDKEGRIKAVDPLELNPKGKHIEVLDNNFFASPEWKQSIEQLIAWKQPVNFHGIDARIMTEEHAYYLNKVKRHKQIHIAWDNPKDDLVPKLKEIIKYIKPYKLMCYVLIGYWSTQEEDYYRIDQLRALGIDPFVMPYNKEDDYQKKFARWVNHKAIFKTVEWKNYKG